ncbi:hypothetical protein ACTFIR_002303 [Dictyostelium discoideum]
MEEQADMLVVPSSSRSSTSSSSNGKISIPAKQHYYIIHNSDINEKCQDSLIQYTEFLTDQATSEKKEKPRTIDKPTKSNVNLKDLKPLSTNTQTTTTSLSIKDTDLMIIINQKKKKRIEKRKKR